MAAARWRLGDGKIRQAVESIDAKARLPIPAEFLEGLGRDFLALLDEPGRVQLIPWERGGDRVAQRYGELVGSPGTELEFAL